MCAPVAFPPDGLYFFHNHNAVFDVLFEAGDAATVAEWSRHVWMLRLPIEVGALLINLQIRHQEEEFPKERVLLTRPYLESVIVALSIFCLKPTARSQFEKESCQDSGFVSPK